jgi:dTDP-4-amino-4,6-dideoxygalactose transaminase
MKNIPFIDLRAQYRSIEAEINSVVLRVLQKGDFILGEEVSLFEGEFPAYCETSFGAGVASGTDALSLALRACEIGRGDEVITTSHTAIATLVGIESTGARPILVDIQAGAFTIDPSRIESSITSNTRAIIPVHLYGSPAELTPILEIARRFDLYVIEDCAQAHGASYRNKKVGAWGDLSAFSFYPTKNLGAYGDAGMVLTSRKDLYERLLLLRQYGWKEKYVSDKRGVNSRLDNLQAAILRVKLGHLDEWNRRRMHIAETYCRGLSGLDIVLPITPENSTHAYHQYVIRSEHRDSLRSHLLDRSIGTSIHYPVPPHLQPAYGDLGYAVGDFPNSESAAREIISLPIHPELSDADVEYVCEAIRDFYSTN